MYTKEELKKQFYELGVRVGDDIVDTCFEISLQYNVPEAELVETWIAYSFTHLSGAQPTMENLKRFERLEFSEKKRSLPPKVTKNVPVFNAVDNTGISPVRNKIPYHGSITPNNKNALDSSRLNFSPAAFSPDIFTPSKTYGTRTNSGQVLSTWGKTLHNWESQNCEIQIDNYEKTNSSEWKYFYSTLRDNSMIIEDWAIEMAQAILAHHDLPEPQPITNQTEEAIFIGRVCPIEKNKSVFIQDICTDSGKAGDIKELDLLHVSEVAFFPGQIVAIKGTTAGNRVIVSEIYNSAPHPLPPSPTIKGHMEILIAAGPMTLSDTLSYEPFHDLINYVVKNKPNILILIGPILDSNHPKMEDGIAETFSDYFARLIKKMQESFKDIDIQIVIISSSKDAMNIPIYPTPVPCESFKGVQFFQDPCVLNINGLIMGITSTDSLMHIGKQEISRISGNRLGILASHLLNQRSFYPLYPTEREAAFDYNIWKKYATLPITPHILILPSDLHCFIKEAVGSVVISPGRLSKGMVGGSFSSIEIQPQGDSPEWKTQTHIAAKIMRI